MSGSYIHESDGTFFQTSTGQSLEVNDIPEGFSEITARPSPFHDYSYDVSDWVLNEDRKLLETSNQEREKRDKKLSSEVDPIAGNALRWADLTDAKRAEWTQYRSDLLNVPQQSGFPSTINWPTKPTE